MTTDLTGRPRVDYDDDTPAGRLASFMSELSEECYCAGWLTYCEYRLWRFVLSGPGEWGVGQVTGRDIAALQHLSAAAGGWITRNGDGCVFVSLAEWTEIYAAAVVPR